MSTQCRFCGEAVRPDSMFCPSCGQLIGMPGNVVPPFPGGAKPTSSGAPAEQRSAQPLAPVPLPAPLAAEPVEQEPVPQEPAPQPASAEAPAPQPVESAAAPASAPVLPSAVTLPSGERLGLDQVLVFGRSPERGAATYQGSPIRLDDPARAMSRVHLVLAPAAGAVIATDPGSANGTLLERDGTQYTLVAGTPSALVPGDRLLLGDAILHIA